MPNPTSVPGVGHLLSIAKMPSTASASGRGGDDHAEQDGVSPIFRLGWEPTSAFLSRPDAFHKEEPSQNCNLFSSGPSAFTPTQPSFHQFAEPSPVPYVREYSHIVTQAPNFIQPPKVGSTSLVIYDIDNAVNEELEEELAEDDNVLTVNILLQFQPVSYEMHQISWAALDVALQVTEKTSNPFTFHSTHGVDRLTSIHTMRESTEIPVDGLAMNVLQKTLEIPMPARGAHEVSFFDVNLIFKETQMTMPEWCITASCYVGLQSARKVLYPIRCSFSRSLVDRTGTRPTFYCSFAVKHNPSDGVTTQTPVAATKALGGGIQPRTTTHNQLSHVFPQVRRVRANLAEAHSDPLSSDSSTSKGTTIPDKSTLKTSSSHGMRPIGPSGRLMTKLQRSTFSSIRKRFAKTPARERKHVLKNSDLYPLFTLGRDECAKEMGTCPTWLKVRMRERGIKVWPNRKLIPTTSTLYRLKQHLQEIEGDITEKGDNEDRSSSLQQLQGEIDALRKVRMAIVRSSVSTEFYANFSAAASPQTLDPDWER